MNEKLMMAISDIFNKDISQLNNATRFKEDLNASSSQLFMLIAELEELTGKTLTYNKVKECVTVDDAIKLLEYLLK